MLTWQTSDGSQGLGDALDYEVSYKREWESWEVRVEKPSCPDLGHSLLGGWESVVKVVHMNSHSILRHSEERQQMFFRLGGRGSLSVCV